MSSHEKWEAIKCWALDLSQLYPDKLLSIPEIVAKIVEIDNLDHRDRVRFSFDQCGSFDGED